VTPGVTHYEVLGVASDASPAEVRRAYVELARTHHPDFHATGTAPARQDAEQRMRQINEAWLVLGDADSRAAYDRELAPSDGGGNERGAGRSAATGGWVPGSGLPDPDFVPVDPGDDEPFPDEDEEGTGRRVPVWQQLLPVALLIASLGSFAAALVLNARPLLILGVGLLVGAGIGFVLTPLFAVLRTNDRDPDR
jgi:curved DNA-binding protein CbpA